MFIRQRECHSYYRDLHYYVIICLLRHYMTRPLPSWLQHLSSLDTTKNEHTHEK